MVGVICDVDGRKALEVSHKGKRDIIFAEDLIKSMYNPA